MQTHQMSHFASAFNPSCFIHSLALITRLTLRRLIPNRVKTHSAICSHPHKSWMTAGKLAIDAARKLAAIRHRRCKSRHVVRRWCWGVNGESVWRRGRWHRHASIQRGSGGGGRCAGGFCARLTCWYDNCPSSLVPKSKGEASAVTTSCNNFVLLLFHNQLTEPTNE